DMGIYIQLCCDVNVARRIAHQTFDSFPTRRSSDLVQHDLLAGRIQLEYHSDIGIATVGGSAVKVASRIADQTCVGVCSVRPAGAVGSALVAGRVQRKYRLATSVANVVGSAVEVAGR